MRKKKSGPKPGSSSMGATSKANVAQSRSKRTGRPNITSSSSGSTIRHREYFSDVVSASTAFQSFSYPINPGVPNIFPWLSKIAQQYETYQFKKLHFEYETQCATTAVGTVIMAIDFDALDQAPVTKTACLSYKDAVRTAPWTPVCLTAALADIKPQQKYVRVGSVASSDLKTYDAGNLQVCLQGVAASTIGELYVDYEVVLTTPQVGAGVGGTLSSNAADESAVAMFGGTAPLTTGFLPFTYTSASTVTFQQSFDGLIGFRVAGSVLSSDLSNTGTCTYSGLVQLVNAAATQVLGTARVRATSGQTFIPTITGTTVTLLVLWVAPVIYENLV